jgi:hypothetical protein
MEMILEEECDDDYDDYDDDDDDEWMDASCNSTYIAF